MSYERLVKAVQLSLFETIAVALILTLGFIAIEPVVSRAASHTDEFLVTQTVSGAIAIANAPVSDVSMVGTLNGLTGGTSYGTTTVRVTTNNSSGYNLTISFSSTTAMSRNGTTIGDEIQNFQYSTSTATYPTGFASAAYAQLGFSVNASTTADISEVFTTNGTLCGTDYDTDTFVINQCWRGASTTNAAATTELMNTTAPTPASGSTSTIQFRVTIPNGPSPAVPDGTYTATATLTATDN